jgi:hypothetical protein
MVAALFSGSGLIDREGSPIDLLAIQGGSSRLSFLTTAHLDKAEAFRLARSTVRDDLG